MASLAVATESIAVVSMWPGLVKTENVADGALDEVVSSLVQELAGFSPLAQRTSKGILNGAQDAPLHVGIELEGQAYGRLRSSHDFREGVESFHEKRKPEFQGN